MTETHRTLLRLAVAWYADQITFYSPADRLVFETFTTSRWSELAREDLEVSEADAFTILGTLTVDVDLQRARVRGLRVAPVLATARVRYAERTVDVRYGERGNDWKPLAALAFALSCP